tara:strand:+ start:467 stop:970 length:504 start_codon:yes stop_codon:yes gene_type:complete
MTDIMMDIETLSVDSNALIISISAIKFDLTTGDTGDTFEMGLNLKDQGDAIMDADTVLWWLSQSKEAQEQLLGLTTEPSTDVLNKFNMWIGKGVYTLWGNGATFDNVIVRNLYKRLGIPFTIPFWNDRCVRTFVDVYNIDTRSYTFVGTKHNGLDDCKHQIKYMTGK